MVKEFLEDSTKWKKSLSLNHRKNDRVHSELLRSQSKKRDHTRNDEQDREREKALGMSIGLSAMSLS